MMLCHSARSCHEGKRRRTADWLTCSPLAGRRCSRAAELCHLCRLLRLQTAGAAGALEFCWSLPACPAVVSATVLLLCPRAPCPAFSPCMGQPSRSRRCQHLAPVRRGSRLHMPAPASFFTLVVVSFHLRRDKLLSRFSSSRCLELGPGKELVRRRRTAQRLEAHWPYAHRALVE